MFKRKTTLSFCEIADVIEKTEVEEMTDGCISRRIVKEVVPKTNSIPYSHGGLHHYAVTGEPLTKVPTSVLNPDRFEELADAPDNV